MFFICLLEEVAQLWVREDLGVHALDKGVDSHCTSKALVKRLANILLLYYVLL